MYCLKIEGMVKSLLVRKYVVRLIVIEIEIRDLWSKRFKGDVGNYRNWLKNKKLAKVESAVIRLNFTSSSKNKLPH